MEHSLNSNRIREDDCNDKGTEETRLFFVFIPHKRDLYIGPKRVFSRHDGHQAFAHGKSAEQEDFYSAHKFVEKKGLLKSTFFRGLVSRHDGHQGI
jgi:hypothetical protein